MKTYFDSRNLLKLVCIPFSLTIIVLNVLYLDLRQPIVNMAPVLKSNTSQAAVVIRNILDSSHLGWYKKQKLFYKHNLDHDHEDQAIEWLMRERRQVLRKECPLIKLQKEESVPQFIQINTLNMLYLPVPKVGCTNWKKIIMMIEGLAFSLIP